MSVRSGRKVKVQVRSLPDSAISLRGVSIRLHHVQLSRLFDVLPCVPSVAKLLSTRTRCVRARGSLRLSTRTDVSRLACRHRHVNSISLKTA